VGVGTEILFMITLGLVVLGPKRLHSMMGQQTVDPPALSEVELVG
jgi:Sec-independent protein translocase protein TatA